MIKVIIFDLGGVILKHSANLLPDTLVQLFSMSEEEAAALWKENRVKLLKGELASEDFFKNLQKKYKRQSSIAELLKREGELYRENAKIDYDVLSLVQELGQKYRVYLLTDTIEAHDAYNKTRDIYNQFTDVFKSYKEKLAKADGKDFFVHVLKEINAEPQECIFIDDSPEYVEVAERLGMKGIVFKNLIKLKEDLEKLDV